LLDNTGAEKMPKRALRPGEVSENPFGAELAPNIRITQMLGVCKVTKRPVEGDATLENEAAAQTSIPHVKRHVQIVQEACGRFRDLAFSKVMSNEANLEDFVQRVLNPVRESWLLLATVVSHNRGRSDPNTNIDTRLQPPVWLKNPDHMKSGAPGCAPSIHDLLNLSFISGSVADDFCIAKSNSAEAPAVSAPLCFDDPDTNRRKTLAGLNEILGELPSAGSNDDLMRSPVNYHSCLRPTVVAYKEMVDQLKQAWIVSELAKKKA
jgi:hypothetical protein